METTINNIDIDAIIENYYEQEGLSKRPQAVFFKLELHGDYLYSIQHKLLPIDTVGFKGNDLVVRK